MQRSQIGRQVDSQKRTGAAFGFGTAKRFPGEGQSQFKQYISKEHMKNCAGMEKTPGPGTYMLEGAFGDQKVSGRRTFNIVHFQRNQRFAQDVRETRQKQRIPAPWQYKAESSTGVQMNSKRPTEPTVKFGSEGRNQHSSIGKGFEEHLYGQSPGAIYDPPSSMGRQPNSGKAKGPAFHFGTEPCHTDPKIISALDRRSGSIPGPGQYAAQSACAPQASSLQRSYPVYGMGSATRTQAGLASLEPHRAPVVLGGTYSPGTAVYNEDVSSFKKGIISTKRNNPSHVFGTDDKFARNRSTGHLAPGPGAYCV